MSKRRIKGEEIYRQKGKGNGILSQAYFETSLRLFPFLLDNKLLTSEVLQIVHYQEARERNVKIGKDFFIH